MLKVLSGGFDIVDSIPYWVQFKLLDIFDSVVREDWLMDPIVLDELRDVDHIVKVDGLMLTKEDGDRIPVNWLSQGTKQFLFATHYPSKRVIDCYNVGWNVFKYFYFWCEEKNVDIVLLTNSNEMLNLDVDLKGYHLNADKYFNSNRELADIVYKYRRNFLSADPDKQDWLITASTKDGKKKLIQL